MAHLLGAFTMNMPACISSAGFILERRYFSVDLFLLMLAIKKYTLDSGNSFVAIFAMHSQPLLSILVLAWQAEARSLVGLLPLQAMSKKLRRNKVFLCICLFSG